MASTVITLNQGTITKVLDDIKEGEIVCIKNDKLPYYYDFVAAGGAAPTEKKNFALLFREHPIREKFVSSVGIDVYVFCPDRDSAVRADTYVSGS